MIEFIMLIALLWVGLIVLALTAPFLLALPFGIAVWATVWYLTHPGKFSEHRKIWWRDFWKPLFAGKL